jgi:hypothetical protein
MFKDLKRPAPPDWRFLRQAGLFLNAIAFNHLKNKPIET